jgi:deazaflavin-dependent oxidoreductase (nitroreductase family)
MAENHFVKLTLADRIFNGIAGALFSLGLGFRHNFVLQVPGRKSGKIYSLPVDVLEYSGKRYLVAPRGRTEWVRNGEAAGSVTLKRGSDSRKFQIRSVPASDRPELLRAYLNSFKLAVQRFFPVKAGSPVSDFVPIADRYPVFELIASD